VSAGSFSTDVAAIRKRADEEEHAGDIVDLLGP